MKKILTVQGMMLALLFCFHSAQAQGITGDELSVTFTQIRPPQPPIDNGGTNVFDFGTHEIGPSGTVFANFTTGLNFNVTGSGISLSTPNGGVGFSLTTSITFVDNSGNIPGVYTVASTDVPGLTDSNLSTVGNSFTLTLTGLAFSGSQTAVFLLGPAVSPVPEPDTYLTALAGLGLLGLVASRKGRKIKPPAFARGSWCSAGPALS